MSLLPGPMPALAVASIAINPLEQVFMAINTNPYFIGLMMLLLNMGGRFLGMELSKEQEKLFQNPWIRRALFFTVLFVATRNVFVAAIMTLFVLLIFSFLLNENSELCLWQESCSKQSDDQAPMQGLTPEETEIWRRLNEKQMRLAAANVKKKDTEDETLSIDNVYANNIAKLRV